MTQKAGAFFLLMIVPLSVCLAAPSPGGYIQSLNAQYHVQLDWRSGELKLFISAPLLRDGARNQASIVSRQEYHLRSIFPSVFPLALEHIRIDSRRSLRDLYGDDPDLELDLRDFAGQARLIRSQPAGDLKSVELEYVFPLYPWVSNRLIRFASPHLLDEVLDWKPSVAYTGLVIYAQDNLPWYGTQETAQLIPSLFPTIYDEDMRLVVSVNHANPSTTASTGFILFTDSTNMPQHVRNRVGTKPFMIAAKGIFGVAPTDPLISRSDAEILLYNEQSRRALTEGRIVIIVPPENAVESVVR